MCHGGEVRLALRALHLGLLVARQTLHRLQRRHASQEPARRDAVVRHKRERTMELRLRSHGHRARQRRRRGRRRARRSGVVVLLARGRGAAAAAGRVRQRGRVVARWEREGGCERREGPQCCVEQTVHVPARRAVRMEVC